VLATAGNLIALCWFGMWMGMTSRTANLATLKTLLFVQIVPWLVIAFGSSMLIMAVMMPYFMRSNASPATGLSWMAWYSLLSLPFGIILIGQRYRLHHLVAQKALFLVPRTSRADPRP